MHISYAIVTNLGQELANVLVGGPGVFTREPNKLWDTTTSRIWHGVEKV
jgi:hypothetical protein